VARIPAFEQFSLSILVSFNPSDTPNEFNDVSIISCLTGWLPEPIPLRYGHGAETWRFLRETVAKYQWPEETSGSTGEPAAAAGGPAQAHDEAGGENSAQAAENDAESASRDQQGKQPDGSSSKSKAKGGGGAGPATPAAGKLTMAGGAKEAKAADAAKPNSKKDAAAAAAANKKGKSMMDEAVGPDESFSPEFPEMVVLASFVDLPISKLSASTEVADRREMLRRYNLSHDFSNPAWITCTRDVPLVPPAPPEQVPLWKTIRQRKRHVVPCDEPVMAEPPKPDQWVEIKSPYVGLRPRPTAVPPLPPITRTVSRFSRVRSRQDSRAVDLIDENEENKGSVDALLLESHDASVKIVEAPDNVTNRTQFKFGLNCLLNSGIILEILGYGRVG
jgi:hypothetical protein